MAVALVERWLLRKVKVLKSEYMDRPRGQEKWALVYRFDCIIKQLRQ